MKIIKVIIHQLIKHKPRNLVYIQRSCSINSKIATLAVNFKEKKTEDNEKLTKRYAWFLQALLHNCKRTVNRNKKLLLVV